MGLVLACCTLVCPPTQAPRSKNEQTFQLFLRACTSFLPGIYEQYVEVHFKKNKEQSWILELSAGSRSKSHEQLLHTECPGTLS